MGSPWLLNAKSNVRLVCACVCVCACGDGKLRLYYLFFAHTQEERIEWMEAIHPSSGRILRQSSRRIATEPPPNSASPTAYSHTSAFPHFSSSPSPSGLPTLTNPSSRQPAPSHHPQLSHRTSCPSRLSPSLQEAAQRQENHYTVNPSASLPLGSQARHVQDPYTVNPSAPLPLGSQFQDPKECVTPIPSSQRPVPRKRASYGHAHRPHLFRRDRANTSPLISSTGGRATDPGTDDLPDGAYSSQPRQAHACNPAPHIVLQLA